MTELFTRYDPATPPEERRCSPVCVASYPEPCGERAVGEGWGCLPAYRDGRVAVEVLALGVVAALALAVL